MDEINKLTSYVDDNEQLLLFLKLALCIGARFETLNQIKKKDINIESKMITLTDFKNKSTYKGFITDDIIPLIIERLEYLEINDYLLNYHDTKDLRSKIAKMYKPILDQLFNEGLDKSDSKNRVVIHTFRHTFASHLAINGTPIYTIQKLMNHKDITMTMRYAKLAPDSGQSQVNELYK
ncbi:MAG: tyrosine-type recombinase/integrase [Campylobacterota bacterium]|nr:tyrosine-type recombinase/integrase [Campylobacterota bacterium]